MEKVRREKKNPNRICIGLKFDFDNRNEGGKEVMRKLFAESFLKRDNFVVVDTTRFTFLHRECENSEIIIRQNY